MTSCRNLLSYVWFCVFLTLVIASDDDENLGNILKRFYYFALPRFVNLSISNEILRTTCNEIACPGPVAHYKSLPDCMPVFDDDGCCPLWYNCDRISNKTKDKCYIKNHVYEVGERIRAEDAISVYPEENYTCTHNLSYGAAFFNSPQTNRTELCPSLASNASCYLRNSVHQYCAEEVCPKPPENVKYWCEDADGKIFSDGEYALLKDQPDKLCVCQANITGGHFSCKSTNRWLQSNINATTSFFFKCAPIYMTRLRDVPISFAFQRLWRCPTLNDEVICPRGYGQEQHKEYNRPQLSKDYVRKRCKILFETAPRLQINLENLRSTLMDFARPTYRSPVVCSAASFNEEMRNCIFGDKIMHIGDKLNNVSYDNNMCLMCTCEVPPVPTCVLRVEPMC